MSDFYETGIDPDADFYDPELVELDGPAFDPQGFLAELAERDEQLLGRVEERLGEVLGPLAGAQEQQDEWAYEEGVRRVNEVLDGLTGELGDFDRERTVAVADQMVDQFYAENPGSTIPSEHVARTALHAAARTVAEMARDPLEAAGATAAADRTIGAELDKLRGFRLTEEQRSEAIQLATDAFRQHVERGGRHDDDTAALAALRGAAELVAGEPVTETDAARRYVQRLEVTNAQHPAAEPERREPLFPDADTEVDVMARLFPISASSA